MILQISFTQIRRFFHFLRPMSVYFDGDGKIVVRYKQPAILLVRRDVNIKCLWSHWWDFWEFKFNSEHFPRTSQFFDFYRLWLFVFLQEPASLIFPIKNTDGHFPYGGVSVLKITEMRFGLLVQYFWGSFFPEFAVNKASLVIK